MSGDIELEIGATTTPGSFTVRVIRAAAGGEPSGTFILDVPGLLRELPLLEATVLASAVPRRSVPVAERPVREVGQQLFEALFSGPIAGMYRASLGVAQQRGNRLRVVLRLTAPELVALPWEMLFDPETEAYLCRREPLVRHVPASYTEDPLEIQPPLRILGLVASPHDFDALDVEAEKNNLVCALAEPVDAGLIELVWLSEATWEGVHARLLAQEWHVLHFIGHGNYDVVRDEGALALVRPDGRADRVEASRLADLLAEAQPMPRLVVLNSCSSGQTGTNDLFSGTASALVRSGISTVAVMRFAISDTAATAFARGFYTAIAHGRSIDEAARSGRIAILRTPRSLEWVTPVLYVRGEARQLFALTSTPANRVTGPAAQEFGAAQAPEPAWRRQAQLRALYIAARAELRIGRFDEAVSLLDDLINLEPGYSDAVQLRHTAWRSARLASTYAQARTVEDNADWAEAAHLYGQVLELERGYRDATTRQKACLTQLEISDLQAELRYHADAGQWRAVLDTDAELTRLDPKSADPDGLATVGREKLGISQIKKGPRTVRSKIPLSDISMSALDWHRLRDAMASVFDSRIAAFNVLDRIGFPRDRRPSFYDNPLDAWTQIFNSLDNGIIASPRRQLLLAASTVYPFNPVFLELSERYGVVAPRDWAADPAPDELAIALACHVIVRARSEQERAAASRALSDLGLDPHDVWATAHASSFRVNSDNASAVRELLDPTGLSWVVVPPEANDYLIRELYVDGPDQRRFRLIDVPAQQTVADVVAGIMAHYGASFNSESRRAVVDRVLPSGEGQRLPDDMTLPDTNLREGDSLRLGFDQ